MSAICPSAEKCPIFSGVLKDSAFATKSYKAQYCEAGEAGRNQCKRWLCKEKYGKVPETLLPNSNMTLEEIGQKQGWL